MRQLQRAPETLRVLTGVAIVLVATSGLAPPVAAQVPRPPPGAPGETREPAPQSSAQQAEADEQAQGTASTASLGLGVSGVVPRGEFGQSVDSGWGIMGHLGGRFLGGWLGARLDGGYLEYGVEESHDVVWVLDTPITLDLATKNTIWLGAVGPEFTLPTSRLLPHLYALIGLAYFRTDTSVSTDTDLDEPVKLESTTHLSDTTFGFTLGGGLVVPFASAEQTVFAVSVDGAYRTYGNTRYLREGSITEVDGRAVFTPIESDTSFWEIRVGLWLGL